MSITRSWLGNTIMDRIYGIRRKNESYQNTNQFKMHRYDDMEPEWLALERLIPILEDIFFNPEFSTVANASKMDEARRIMEGKLR